MDTGLLGHGCIGIPAGTALRARDAAGHRIVVGRGSVWITQERDPRDVVLGPGDGFRFDRTGMALLQAVGGEASIAAEEGIRFESQGSGAVEAVHETAERPGRGHSWLSHLIGAVRRGLQGQGARSVGQGAGSARPGNEAGCWPMIDAISRHRTGAGGPY